MRYYQGMYHFTSKASLPAGQEYIMDQDFKIESSMQSDGSCTIELCRTGEMLIDELPPEEFDAVMAWMGNSIYPVVLNLSASGVRVGNFEEVRQRIEKESYRIIDYYGHDAFIMRYVEACMKNICNEQQLSDCLGSSNIVQLLKLGIGIASTQYILVDFPVQGNEQHVEIVQECKENEENRYTFSMSDEDSNIISEEGIISIQEGLKGIVERIMLSAEAEVSSVGYYTRKIELIKKEDNVER